MHLRWYLLLARAIVRSLYPTIGYPDNMLYNVANIIQNGNSTMSKMKAYPSLTTDNFTFRFDSSFASMPNV